MGLLGNLYVHTLDGKTLVTNAIGLACFVQVARTFYCCDSCTRGEPLIRQNTVWRNWAIILGKLTATTRFVFVPIQEFSLSVSPLFSDIKLSEIRQ